MKPSRIASFGPTGAHQILEGSRSGAALEARRAFKKERLGREEEYIIETS
jgi:hypothetical protein